MRQARRKKTDLSHLSFDLKGISPRDDKMTMTEPPALCT